MLVGTSISTVTVVSLVTIPLGLTLAEIRAWIGTALAAAGAIGLTVSSFAHDEFGDNRELYAAVPIMCMYALVAGVMVLRNSQATTE